MHSAYSSSNSSIFCNCTPVIDPSSPDLSFSKTDEDFGDGITKSVVTISGVGSGAHSPCKMKGGNYASYGRVLIIFKDTRIDVEMKGL